jgi:hypothetical protein
LFRAPIPYRKLEVSAHLFYTARMVDFAAGLLVTQGQVQLVAGIGAVALVAIIILRRKGKKKASDDEF